jgi:hypothetical protein
MKKLNCLIIIISCFYPLLAQEKPAKNTVSIGFGGAAITGSINYERLVFFASNQKIQAKIGVGYFPLFVNGEAKFGTLTKVLGVEYLYSLGTHHIETAFSNCFAETFDESVAEDKFSKTSYILVPSVGYRYRNYSKRGIMFQAGYSPLISLGGIGVEPKKVFYRNYIYLGIGIGF